MQVKEMFNEEADDKKNWDNRAFSRPFLVATIKRSLVLGVLKKLSLEMVNMASV